MKTTLKLSAFLIFLITTSCSNSKNPSEESPSTHGGISQVDLTPLTNKSSYLKLILSESLIEEVIDEAIGMYKEEEGWHIRDAGLLAPLGCIVLSKSFREASKVDSSAELSNFTRFQMSPLVWEWYWLDSVYTTSRKALYEKMRNVGRSSIDEKTLLELYECNKGYLLSKVNQHNIRIQLLEDLQATLPYFDETLDSELDKLLEDYFKRYRLRGPFIYHSYSQNKERKATIRQITEVSEKVYGKSGEFAIHTFSWKERRKMEYGDEYVKTYGYVISDLIQELKQTNTKEGSAY